MPDEVVSFSEGGYQYEVKSDGVVEISKKKIDDPRGYFCELTRPDNLEKILSGFQIRQAISADLIDNDWEFESDCGGIYSVPEGGVIAIVSSTENEEETETYELSVGKSIYIPQNKKVKFRKTNDTPGTIIAMREKEKEGLPETIFTQSEKIPGLTISQNIPAALEGASLRNITPQHWRDLQGSFRPEQANLSMTQVNNARGAHAENMPKFVTTIKGRIYAFFIDFREQSQGSVEMVEIQPGTSVYIPEGVGNSFVTTDQEALYFYLVALEFQKINRERQTAFSITKVLEMYEEGGGILPFDRAGITLKTDRDKAAITDYSAMKERVRDNR